MIQVLWLLLSPVLPGSHAVSAASAASPASAASAAEFVLGLAVVAAALLVVVAAAGVSLPAVRAFGVAARLRPRSVARRSRVSDPDAAGRPRPRAPSEYPAAS